MVAIDKVADMVVVDQDMVAVVDKVEPVEVDMLDLLVGHRVGAVLQQILVAFVDLVVDSMHSALVGVVLTSTNKKIYIFQLSILTSCLRDHSYMILSLFPFIDFPSHAIMIDQLSDPLFYLIIELIHL